MFKNKVLDLDLCLKKSISECVSPAKIISTSNTLKSKFSGIDPISLENSQDLTCFFISGFKSKTQVNSPTYTSFIKNPSLKFNDKDEKETKHESYQFRVFARHSKPEDHKKGKFYFFEPGEKQENPENKGKILNKKQENINKIQYLLGKIKRDQQEFRDFFHDFSDFKNLLQDSLMEVTKQLSEKRNNGSCKDPNIKVFSLKNQYFKEFVFGKFEETAQKLFCKMKSGVLGFNQKIAGLKLEIFQKNQKIQKILKNCADLGDKNKQLEQLNTELKSELDTQFKENSVLMQKYLKTFKDLCNIKSTKSGSLINKNEENEVINKENQELKKNLNELEGIIYKLTKNNGFSQLQQENECLKNQLKDLTIKFNIQSEKSEKIQEILKSLQESKHFSVPKPQVAFKNIENNEDLSSDYQIISQMQSLPITSVSFDSFLPKIQKFVTFLESMLNFRLNKHKSFVFPSKILDHQQIPTKFIEKTFSYLQFLIKFSSELLKNASNSQSSEGFIKELEYLIFSINEKHFEDTQKMWKEFKKQESLFLEEILSLKNELLLSKNQLNVDLRVEKEFITPKKTIEMTEFEVKIQELSESAKKYKEKNKLLKSVNKELDCQNASLIDELREFQFNQKIS